MRDELEQQIRAVARESFSRSGGPGGQNVNKVNTQVTIHLPIVELGVSAPELNRLRERLSSRLTVDDELVIQCSETRSQAQNREIAVQRALSLVDGAIRPQKKRRPTRPSRAARERRLEKKRIRGERKRMRRPPGE